MANKISPGQPLRQQLLPRFFRFPSVKETKKQKKSSAHAEPFFKYAPP